MATLVRKELLSQYFLLPVNKNFNTPFKIIYQVNNNFGKQSMKNLRNCKSVIYNYIFSLFFYLHPRTVSHALIALIQSFISLIIRIENYRN